MNGNNRAGKNGSGLGLLDILLPQVTIPVKGVFWISKKLYETAVSEFTDKSKIQQQLLELQIQYELEEISDEDYQEQEKALLDQLESIREYEHQTEVR